MTKTIQDNPTISDTIVFSFKTTDANDCAATPYKVDKIVVYYVERNFTSGNLNAYKEKNYDLDKLKAAETAEAVACATPTTDNVNKAKRLRAEAESNVSVNPFYFNEAKPVHVVGNDGYPAWLSTDLGNAYLELVDTGEFTYTWQPQGMREGDYFICWTWTPLIAGDSFSSHQKFSLVGDTQVTTSIPTHFTDPLKYPTLLDRYTPEMFKMYLCDTDRTPDVLDKFNKAIGLGFNTLEDLANQLPDLQDANSIHEALIPHLSNLFGLKLKTGDPTRWRGQIKRAIPVYKMKGTKKGLSEALEHAGIKMLKLIQLWQIISSYTWQESFLYSGDIDFTLEKAALPVDSENFELWLRPADGDDWVQLDSDYVDFSTSEGSTIMTWVGNTLSVNALDLIDGDEIRVLYLYHEIPDGDPQTIEEYIRSLPLMDQRDERDQEYPPKNWNVRLIAPDDPLFDIVIPTRHPFHDPLIYGKVRTEFPYSENIYNMEEYNGSIRNSKNPCDIDKEFVDPCTACISSCYNIDLEIEELSNDRVFEAKQVLTENTPFHAVLHTMNFIGGINEFVESPEEEVEALVSISGEEFVVAGEAQMYFNRIMKLVQTQGILRSDLATSFVAVPTTSGTAYNNELTMFCPSIQMDDLGIALDSTAVLSIKSPSPLAGEYNVNNPIGNTITVISGSVEPIDDCDTFFASDGTLNTCAFTFDINNPIAALNSTLCDIVQDNIFRLSDSTQDFGALGVQTTKDVNAGTASAAWKVLISAYDATAYVINDIMPDGSLVLEDTGSLPGSNVTDITYILYNDITPVISSDVATLTVTKRGRVQALSSGVLPISNMIKVNENFYQKISGTEYLVVGFAAGSTSEFYVDGYDGGDAAGVSIDMSQKIIKQRVGYLSHRGLMLKMSGNLEADLGIQNGANSLVVVDDGVENDGFKENFIVVIGDDSYWISEIDGDNPSGYTTITLSGPDHYWTTLPEGGTSVDVTIYQYLKQGATIMGQQYELPEHTFRTLDRAGRSVITGTTSDDEVVVSLNAPEGNTFSESVYQNEGISFQIQYEDGSQEEGQV